MFIGAILVFIGMWYGLGLVLFPTLRKSLLVSYTIYSTLLGIGLMIGFIGLSAWKGIIVFGRPMTLSIPGDYLARGLAGWSILLVGILSVLAPVIMAIWLETTDYHNGF